MKRLVMQLTIVLTITGLWFSSHALAFRLHLGANANPTEFHTGHTTNGADIPTPQFFRGTVGNPGAPADLTPSPDVSDVPQPDVLIVKDNTTRPAQPQPAAQAHHGAPDRHLNGVELFLLRQTQTVASESGRKTTTD